MGKKEMAAAPEAPKAKAKTKAPYEVAKGCSITTKKRTVLSEGEGITVADLSGGEKAFETLVAVKKIVKN